MKKNALVIAMMIVMGLLLVTGCGPNQWAAKEVIDGSSMKHGDVVTVQQKNGHEITGTFVGVSTMSSEEYKSFYKDVYQTSLSGDLIPKLGQRVEFVTNLSDTKVWDGELVGFENGALLVKLDGEKEPTEVYIPSVAIISGQNGATLQRMKFRELYLNGDFPLLNVIVMKTSSGTVQVPISTIRDVTINKGKFVDTYTLNAGLMLDHAEVK